MTANKSKSAKGKHVGYWIVTSLLIIGIGANGFAQIFEAKFQIEGAINLGYPLYFLKILGTWKILGAIALLVPRYPLLKEWAYAGFFFLLTGATISHLAVGDEVAVWIGSFIFAVLTVVSWKLRPANRRVTSMQ